MVTINFFVACVLTARVIVTSNYCYISVTIVVLGTYMFTFMLA